MEPQQIQEPNEEEIARPLPKSRRPKKLFVLIGVAAFLVAVLGFAAFRMLSKPEPAREPQTINQAEQVQTDPGVVTILATGDWIAHDAINEQAKQSDGSYDYKSMVEPMKNTFAKSDVNFCNLATLAAGEKFGVSGYPVFNAPTSWIDAMDYLGCNLYNTGTNHTNDKGYGPIKAQLDYLDTVDGVLAHAGSNRSYDEMNSIRYFETKGVKFAFLSYSTYSNVANPEPYSLTRYTDSLAQKQVSEAATGADVVIVSMRWGKEYSNDLTTQQEQIAGKLSEFGADIIFGHGTHTLQAVDILTNKQGNKTYVWYGLGNFLNAQLEVGGLTGCMASISISTETKEITQNLCAPWYQHYEWTKEEKAAEDLLARHNFLIMPLYEAGEFVTKSQLSTTVDEQTDRIRAAVNKLTDVQLINANDN